MTHCPRCHQPLPEPRERFCIHCGAPLEPEAAEPAAEDAGAPPAGEQLSLPAGPAPGREGSPWDRRADVGFFTALVDTTLQVLSKPRAFYQRMAVQGGLGPPLAYGVLVGYVGLAATAVYDAIFESILGREPADLGLGPELDRALAMAQGGPGLLIQLVVGPVALAIGLMLASAINHLVLKLVGGAKHEFEATFRVVAFSKATSLVSLVPVCGPVGAVVWSAIVSIIGLQTVHETTLGKAAAAVLLPVLVACCCCAGAVGLIAAMAASAVR
jgi:hypothetical protein